MVKKSAPKITLRPYRANDKKHLIACVEALQDHFTQIDITGTFTRRPAYGKVYTDYILKEVQKHQGLIHVAMANGKMVGFVSGAIYKKTKFKETYMHPNITGWVLLLYVDSDYRDQKIGTKLMDILEAYFIKKNCDIIRLEAVGSHQRPYQYYKRRGYQAWSVDMIKPLKQAK